MNAVRPMDFTIRGRLCLTFVIAIAVMACGARTSVGTSFVVPFDRDLIRLARRREFGFRAG